MADLSKAEARVSRQDRLTEHRSGIIPERRDTDAPKRQTFADIRNARRGDGGAGELMRALGMVQGAAKDFQGYANAEFEKREDQNAEQGALDGLQGKADPEKEKESFAYRKALSSGRVQKEWFGNVPAVKQGLDELLTSQTSENPAEREAQIDEYLETAFRGFALDQESGEIRDFGTPESMKWIASQMAQLRPNLRTEAVAFMKKKMDTESIENAAGVLNGMLSSGQVADGVIEQLFTHLTPTADRKVAKEAFLNTFKAWAVSAMETDPEAVKRVGQMFMQSTRGTEGAKEASLVTEVLKPTGRLPVQGAVTSDMHRHVARGSVGVDIDGRIGDPVEAPAGGKVKIGRDERAGLHVIIDHGNGVVSSYSHLSKVDLKDGDTVRPGQVFAAVGNTGNVQKGKGGDGSHLHYRVKVNGKDVDPLSHQFAETTVTGTPSGPSTWSADERLDLGQFMSSVEKRIEQDQKEVESKLHDDNRSVFLDRLNGVPDAGPPPTPQEIKAARAKNLISASDSESLLNWIENDEDERHADADHAEMHRRRLAGDEDMFAGMPGGGLTAGSQDILSLTYQGQLSISDAKQEVLRRAAAGFYGTGKARNKRTSAIITELNRVGSTRASSIQANPSFQLAKGKIDAATARMKAAVSRTPWSPTRKAKAIKEIDTLQNGVIAGIGKTVADVGNADTIGPGAYKWFGETILNKYPDLRGNFN